jgi:hypothetical protein
MTAMNEQVPAEERTAINWPTSKGDPIKPVWSYGGKKGLSQAEALRAFAHDLVEIIKEFEMPLKEAMKQAGGDGLSAYPYIKMLTRRINGLESANTDLRASLRHEENARKVLADENDRLRKDAQRYRWLRHIDRSYGDENKIRAGDGYLLSDRELDAAIDAAMEQKS